MRRSAETHGGLSAHLFAQGAQEVRDFPFTPPHGVVM